MTDAEHPDAGWYPDPERPGGLRWWDGSGWTDHRELADPAPAQAGALPVPEASTLARSGGPGPTATPVPVPETETETSAPHTAPPVASPDWAGPARAAGAQHPAFALPAAPYAARVWASLVDGLVALVLAAAAAFVYIAIDGTGTIHDSNDIPTGLFVVVVAVVALYGPILLSITGGWTVGRRVAGYRVAPLDSGRLGPARAFYRELIVKGALGVFTIPLLASYVWPLFEPHQRALHDIFAGTRPVQGWQVPGGEAEDVARRAGLEG